MCGVFILSKMWAYLEHVVTLLENIGNALRAIPDTEHVWVRAGLSTQSRSTSVGRQAVKKRAALTTSRCVQYVTSDGGELKPGQSVCCVYDFCEHY